MKKQIDNELLYQLSLLFRTAIEKAKNNNEFNRKDRMSRFPMGCCDDSCDLLAFYLKSNYGIQTKQGNGVLAECTDECTNHAWLVLEDGTIVDITIDQFKNSTDFYDSVYVGGENQFYRKLSRKRIYNNYDITQDERLWGDYLIIANYLNNT